MRIQSSGARRRLVDALLVIYGAFRIEQASSECSTVPSMEGKADSLVRSKLTKQIRSGSVGRKEISRLLQVLEERTDTARKIELDHFGKLDQSDELYERNKKTIADSFELRIAITGEDGRTLSGPIEDTLGSPNLPEELKSVFAASDSILEGAYNYRPRNFVHVFLDFSKPAVLDWSIMPSQATPNGSCIVVEGYDATWVHGVFNEVIGFFKEHPSGMTWIHKQGVYDLFVWLLGLPFGFWLCYRLSGVLHDFFGGFSTFVLSAAYVYVVIVCLFAFRFFFHYARWIWPLVEYRGSRSRALRHRVILGAIVLSVAGALIWDIVKAIW